MPDISVEHRLNCSEETFWSKVFFDLDYNRRLSIDCLNFTCNAWYFDRAVDSIEVMSAYRGLGRRLGT